MIQRTFKISIICLPLLFSGLHCFFQLSDPYQEEDFYGDSYYVPPEPKTDYTFSIQSNMLDIRNYKVNGIPFMHSGFTIPETVAVIDYEINKCNIYGCWFDYRQCTVDYTILGPGYYTLHFFDNGNSCKIKPGALEFKKYPEIWGVVVNTTSQYQLILYNSTAHSLANVTVNSQALGVIRAYQSNNTFQTTSQNINLSYQVATCVLGYCSYAAKACNISLSGLNYGHHFVHIIDSGNTCILR